MATDKQSAEKEYTVEEKLSTLYQLQTMMTEIDKIKTLRGGNTSPELSSGDQGV